MENNGIGNTQEKGAVQVTTAPSELPPPPQPSTYSTSVAVQSLTEEVVGGSDGMDVARQVKIELLHWDHL